MTTILFWDIDGTLLNSGGAGRVAITRAASEMIGREVDLSPVVMAGMTDWAISAQILSHIGLSPEAVNIEILLDLYQKHLPSGLSETEGDVIPGIFDILQTLQGREDVLSLLLTGNIEPGAWLKLSYYGLDGFFSAGGFCNATFDRNHIARQALTIAQEKLGIINLDKCYVIGDTPHDVSCGQSIGAKTIAIASQRYSVQDLAACNSWLVWERFPDPARFMEKIGLDNQSVL